MKKCDSILSSGISINMMWLTSIEFEEPENIPLSEYVIEPNYLFKNIFDFGEELIPSKLKDESYFTSCENDEFIESSEENGEFRSSDENYELFQRIKCSEYPKVKLKRLNLDSYRKYSYPKNVYSASAVKSKMLLLKRTDEELQKNKANILKLGLVRTKIANKISELKISNINAESASEFGKRGSNNSQVIEMNTQMQNSLQEDGMSNSVPVPNYSNSGLSFVPKFDDDLHQNILPVNGTNLSSKQIPANIIKDAVNSSQFNSTSTPLYYLVLKPLNKLPQGSEAGQAANEIISKDISTPQVSDEGRIFVNGKHSSMVSYPFRPIKIQTINLNCQKCNSGLNFKVEDYKSANVLHCLSCSHFWEKKDNQVTNLHTVYQCLKCMYIVKSMGKLIYHMNNHEYSTQDRCTGNVQEESGEKEKPRYLYDAELIAKRDSKLPVQSESECMQSMFKVNIILGKMKFNCNECPYETRKLAQILSHVAHHIQPGKFRCTVCSFKGKSAMILKIHMLSVHGKLKIYECELCSYASNNKIDYRAHNCRQYKKIKNALLLYVKPSNHVVECERLGALSTCVPSCAQPCYGKGKKN